MTTKTVREFSSIGPCITLGTLTRSTAKMVYFTTREGREERRGGHRLECGLIHVEPCRSCRDHAESQYPNGYEN
jgi:hypothetical protein